MIPRQRSASTIIELEKAIERVQQVRRRWFVLIGLWLALLVVEVEVWFSPADGWARYLAFATGIVALVGIGISIRALVWTALQVRRLREQVDAVESRIFGAL